MPDKLEITHNGETYTASHQDGAWFVEADWLLLNLIPASSVDIDNPHPASDGRLKYTPDHMEPREALNAFAAIRFKFIRALVEKEFITDRQRLKASLRNLIGGAEDAAIALENMGEEGEAKMLRDEINTARTTLELE